MIRTYFRSALLFSTLLSCTSALLAQKNSAKQPDDPAATARAFAELSQSQACPDCAARRRDTDAQETRVFHLKYAVSSQESNEIASSLRTLIPQELVYLDSSASTILVRAISQDMALAEKTISELDRPKKFWRLDYTVTEIEGSQRLGSQHYSMVVADGQETILKQGDRVPIATSGTVNSAMPGSTNAQFVYQDIGMTFGATLSETNTGARLRTDVVQSSLAAEKPAFTAPDPVIRLTEFKGEAVLTPNKPLILGSMDIPGSARRLEIEALIEPLP